jgi:hypothetical protein
MEKKGRQMGTTGNKKEKYEEGKYYYVLEKNVAML